MRFLFASCRSYLPDRVDGAIMSAHSLLRILVQRGHRCEVVAGIESAGRLRLSAYRVRRLLTRRRRLAWPDYHHGYPTLRTWGTMVPHLVAERIGRSRPDLFLTQLEGADRLATRAAEAGVATVVFVHDAEFRWIRGAFAPELPILLVSVSRFVADRVRERLGVESVVLPPIVMQNDYIAPRGAPGYVTLVNPVREKGVEVALQVAALLPHRRFLFVETWPLPPERRRELERRLEALPNVRLHGPTLHMRSIYGKTSLLFAPSQWDEAFGRVLLEAQSSGIPVVASDVGGVSEVIHGGGTLLPRSAPPLDWARAIEDCLLDQQRYARLSYDAKANSTRAEFNPDCIADRFLELAAEHASRAGAVTA
ncbi:MAG TPA: glycosyltransferase [Gemmatimonadales bacterium]|nr:glycosyltransferase [Gemmatimonadales bacterium]